MLNQVKGDFMVSEIFKKFRQNEVFIFMHVGSVILT